MSEINYDGSVNVRLTKEMAHDIEKAIKESHNRDIFYEGVSHFIRCAIIKQLRNDLHKTTFPVETKRK
jgi:hypothetical protein